MHTSARLRVVVSAQRKELEVLRLQKDQLDDLLVRVRILERKFNHLLAAVKNDSTRR